VFHVSLWGAWSFVWGLSPEKPPVATGLFRVKEEIVMIEVNQWPTPLLLHSIFSAHRDNIA